MNRTALGLAALGVMFAAGVQAQTQPSTNPSTTTTPPAARSDDRSGPPTAAAPLAGANSFTEGQARGRIEDAGVTGVASLEKDEHGVWRGRGTRNGAPTDVALDYRGNVVIGAGAARGSLARTDSETDRNRTATGTTGTTTGTTTNRAANAPDGTPGNPPSTMTGRAVDRAQGETPRPDGTPGNPAGTAAGRAVDRTLGTNATGANPSGSNATTGSGPTR
jgi:hypothetical protein